MVPYELGSRGTRHLGTFGTPTNKAPGIGVPLAIVVLLLVTEGHSNQDLRWAPKDAIWS